MILYEKGRQHTAGVYTRRIYTGSRHLMVGGVWSDRGKLISHSNSDSDVIFLFKKKIKHDDKVCTHAKARIEVSCALEIKREFLQNEKWNLKST